MLSYFSVERNPFDIFELINRDNLILDDDEEEADNDTSTAIHDKDEVIKKENRV